MIGPKGLHGFVAKWFSVKSLFIFLAGGVFLRLLPGAGFSMIFQSPSENPDPDGFYLFYLHGRIVEGSDGRPLSRDHGPYEYEKILRAFVDAGFVVISEVRPKDADVEEYARKVAGWVKTLLEHGVSPARIMVVGASKGGVIAARVSNILKNPDIRYAILAGFFRKLHDNPKFALWGHVLSVYDEDDEFEIAPELFFDRAVGLAKRRSIVTETGLGHGLIFGPRPEWLGPVIRWSGLERAVGPETGSGQSTR